MITHTHAQLGVRYIQHCTYSTILARLLVFGVCTGYQYFQPEAVLKLGHIMRQVSFDSPYAKLDGCDKNTSRCYFHTHLTVNAKHTLPCTN